MSEDDASEVASEIDESIPEEGDGDGGYSDEDFEAATMDHSEAPRASAGIGIGIADRSKLPQAAEAAEADGYSEDEFENMSASKQSFLGESLQAEGSAGGSLAEGTSTQKREEEARRRAVEERRREIALRQAEATPRIAEQPAEEEVFSEAEDAFEELSAAEQSESYSAMLHRQRDEAARIRAAEEEAARKKSEEEEIARRKDAEEEEARKKAAEDLAKKRNEERRIAQEKRWKDEEEKAAQKKAEEEAAKQMEEEERAKKSREDEEAAARKKEEEEKVARKKAEDEAEAARKMAEKKEEEEISRKRAEEEEAARKRAEEEEAARKRAEEEEVARRRAKEEEAARKRAEEEEAARKRAEEEEAARKRAEEEEAARKRAAEEEAARKRAEEEEAARKRAEEEEAARKRAEEEEAARKRAEEEEAARKRAEEEEAARKRAEEEEAARKRAEEEEVTRREAEEEEAARKRAEEEEVARRTAKEEEAARKRAEEEEFARRTAKEEEAARKRAEEEEVARRRASEEEAARKRAAEQELSRKRAEEEEAARRMVEEKRAQQEEVGRKRAEEEEVARKRAEGEEEEEEVARKRVEGEEVAKRKVEEENAAKKRTEEQEIARKRAEEEEGSRRRRAEEEEEVAKKRAEEEEVARKRAEEEEVARKRAKEEEVAKKRAEEEELARRTAEEEEIARRRAEEVSRTRAEEEEIARKRDAEEEVARRRAEGDEAARKARGKAEEARKKSKENAAARKKEEGPRRKTEEEGEESVRGHKQATEEREAAKRKDQTIDETQRLKASRQKADRAEAAKKNAEVKEGNEGAFPKVNEEHEGQRAWQTRTAVRQKVRKERPNTAATEWQGGRVVQDEEEEGAMGYVCSRSFCVRSGPRNASTDSGAACSRFLKAGTLAEHARRRALQEEARALDEEIKRRRAAEEVVRRLKAAEKEASRRRIAEDQALRSEAGRRSGQIGAGEVAGWNAVLQAEPHNNVARASNQQRRHRGNSVERPERETRASTSIPLGLPNADETRECEGQPWADAVREITKRIHALETAHFRAQRQQDGDDWKQDAGWQELQTHLNGCPWADNGWWWRSSWWNCCGNDENWWGRRSWGWATQPKWDWREDFGHTWQGVWWRRIGHEAIAAAAAAEDAATAAALGAAKAAAAAEEAHASANAREARAAALFATIGHRSVGVPEATNSNPFGIAAHSHSPCGQGCSAAPMPSLQPPSAPIPPGFHDGFARQGGRVASGHSQSNIRTKQLLRPATGLQDGPSSHAAATIPSWMPSVMPPQRPCPLQGCSRGPEPQQPSLVTSDQCFANTAETCEAQLPTDDEHNTAVELHQPVPTRIWSEDALQDRGIPVSPTLPVCSSTIAPIDLPSRLPAARFDPGPHDQSRCDPAPTETLAAQTIPQVQPLEPTPLFPSSPFQKGSVKMETLPTLAPTAEQAHNTPTANKEQLPSAMQCGSDFGERVAHAVAAVIDEMLQVKYGWGLDGDDFATKAQGQCDAYSVPKLVAHVNSRPDLWFLDCQHQWVLRLTLESQPMSSFADLRRRLRLLPGTASAVAVVSLGTASVMDAVAVFRTDSADATTVVGRCCLAGSLHCPLRHFGKNELCHAVALEPVITAVRKCTDGTLGAGAVLAEPPPPLSREFEGLKAMLEATAVPVAGGVGKCVAVAAYSEFVGALHAVSPTTQVLRQIGAMLERPDTEPEGVLEILCKLAGWLKNESEAKIARDLLVEARVCAPLLAGMRRCLCNLEVCQSACRIISDCSRNHVDNAVAFVECGAAKTICQALENHPGNKEMQQSGMHALGCLAHFGGGSALVAAAGGVGLTFRAVAAHCQSACVQISGCELLCCLAEMGGAPAAEMGEVAQAAKRAFPGDLSVHRSADLLLGVIVPRSAGEVGAVMDKSQADEAVQLSSIRSLGLLATHGGVAWRGAAPAAVGRILRAMSNHQHSADMQVMGLWALCRLVERVEAPSAGMQDAAEQAQARHPRSTLVRRHAKQLAACLQRP